MTTSPHPKASQNSYVRNLNTQRGSVWANTNLKVDAVKPRSKACLERLVHQGTYETTLPA